MIEKERKEAEEIDKRFGLTSEDIENIFDWIEGGAEDVSGSCHIYRHGPCNGHY